MKIELARMDVAKEITLSYSVQYRNDVQWYNKCK